MMDMSGFVAGCIGGGVGILVGHPFDTVKVRLQTVSGGSSKIQYKSLLDCVRQIFIKEGVHGFFKGVTSPLLGVSLQNAFLFGIQRGLMNHMGGTDLKSQFYAGCITGGLQTMLAGPVELAKIQLQLQGIGKQITAPNTKKFKGPFHVLQQFYKTRGVRGVFCGYWITLMRDGPGYGVYFFTYAYLCEKLKPSDNVNGDCSLSLWRLILAGGLCGIISWVQCYPIDVIKSRVQANGFTPHGMYVNYLNCIREIIRFEGYKGFIRGLETTVLRAFPVNAVTLSTVTLLERISLRNTDPPL